MIYYETDYLMHHGVKGQKWGRRKQRALKGRKQGSISYKDRVNNPAVKKIVRRRRAAAGVAAVGALASGAAGMYFGNKAVGKLGGNSTARLVGSTIAGFGAARVGGLLAGKATATALGVNDHQLEKNPNVITVKKAR